MQEVKTKVEENKKFEKEQKEKQQKIDEKLKTCFAAALSTKEGMIAFQLIKKLSLWDEPCSSTNVDSEIYKKGRRDMWLMIREYLPPDILAKIEIYEKLNLEEL